MPPLMSETDLLRPEEIASMLRVDLRTVRRWGSTGRIEVIRLSPRCLRYPAASVQALMAGAERRDETVALVS
jgi:predicted site-specific integrase-resolvase